MAEKGYEAATVAALVEEAGIPPSSIYHYFGSKEGVLLAVMERGAGRFLDAVPDIGRDFRSQSEHLRALVDGVATTLEHHPDFLRILVVMATQPVNAGEGKVHAVVNRVREAALVQLRAQLGVVFKIEAEGEVAEHLARFTLAAFDGAFVAFQSRPDVTIGGLLEHLPV